MDTQSGSFPPARILGIKSSCDETAAAVIENGRALLSSVVASQVELHARYGGVFPEVASRQHIRTIYAVVEEALKDAHLDLGDVDAIAVTRGPGLAGSLVVGVNTAKGLALASDRPLIGVNHLEGHIYSSWVYMADILHPPLEPQFPLMALLVSGGHTELNLMKDHLNYQRLGATQDDAAGEAFDKVGAPAKPALSWRPFDPEGGRRWQSARLPLPARPHGRLLGLFFQRTENGRSAPGA